MPDGVDLAWQSKHYLGLPLSGATMAMVNLAQIVAAVEFAEALTVEPHGEIAAPTADEVVAELERIAAEPAKEAAER